MSKRFLFLGAIILLVGWITAVNTSAKLLGGGGWVTDNQSFWRIERVCRDGYQFTKLNISAPHTSLIQPYRFGAEIADSWFNEAQVIDPAQQQQLDVLFHQYYPQAGRQLPISYADQINQPITTRVGHFSSYYQGVYLFLYPLPVGSHVAFGTGRIDDILPVEDCYLHALDGSLDQEIDPQRYLMPGVALRDYGFSTFGFVEPQALVYELLSLPANGNMRLGQTNLAEGDRFSLAEVQNDGLFYDAGAVTTAVDHFRFRVRGTYRVSPEGSPPRLIPGASWGPSISADGSRLAFASLAIDQDASILDTNEVSDVYLKNLTDDPRVISVEATGSAAAAGPSYGAAISPDGVAVAFVSEAADLVDTASSCPQQADTNGVSDIFVWDDWFLPSPPPNAIRRLSMFNFTGDDCTEIESGSEAPAVAHLSIVKPLRVVFQTSADFPPYLADNGLDDLLISDDFAAEIIYEGLARRGPVAPAGATRAGDISADGLLIAFSTGASNLFPNDGNRVVDVGYKKVGNSDPAVGLGRVSITSDGSEATGGDSFNPSISQLGTQLVFESLATNLSTLGGNGSRQIFVHDRDTGCTIILSVGQDEGLGNGDSVNPSISADGRLIAFESTATNLVPADTNGMSDIFVFDRDPDLDDSFYGRAGRCDPGPSRLFRVSIASDGSEANGHSTEPSLSDNGEFVAFTSQASNLVPRDTNGVGDVFVHYIGYEGEIRFTILSFKRYLPAITK